jgi:histidinol-phosphatase (PHP family)
MADYIEAAIASSLVEFGVSDHGPAYFRAGDHPLPGTQMARSELPHYVREAHELKACYAGRVAVKVGLEADFAPEFEDVCRAMLAAQPFDYVLGSVHWVNGRSIFDRTRWVAEDAGETYAAYYDLLVRAAGSGLFDVLSHLTAVEAYGPPISEELSDRLYSRVADAVAASGCVVEVNTSGYRKLGGDEPFPNRKLLRLLIAAGVPLTFGSDAHRPAEVTFGRERVIALLAELGVDAARAQPVTVRRGPILAVNAG